VENLAKSSGENLKFTTGIIIEPRDCPGKYPHDNSVANETNEDQSNEDSHGGASYNENEDQSSESSQGVFCDNENDLKYLVLSSSEQDPTSLNKLVRLLLLKIPRNQLRLFV